MPSAFTVEVDGATSLRALNYSPLQEAFRRPPAGRNSFRLGDVYSSGETAYGSICTRVDCNRSHGVEFLSQTDMFAAEPTGRIIRLDSMSKPDRHEIQQWQVLIAGVGTLGETELYGRSLIADKRLEGKFLTEDAFTLRAKEPGSTESLYAYAFLCTATGVSLIRSISFGTKMLHLRKSAVPTLCIPDASTGVKERIAALVRNAVDRRGHYFTQMLLARGIIDRSPEVREALSHCQDRKARFSIAAGPFATMAARNHAALGHIQSTLAQSWKSRLSELLEPQGIFKGPRFARVPCKAPYGISFLDQRDIFSIRPIGRRIIAPAVPSNQLYVPPHALIVASRGQFSEGSLFGHVETAAFGLHRHGITEDILRVIPKPEHHDFLLAFLSSKLGFLLLKSTAVGTSIPMMHTGLLGELPYPPLTDSARAEISAHVQAAIKSRVESEAAENEAVRLIEQEVLPSWLA